MAGSEPEAQVPFSIEAFTDWYDKYREQFLEPARETAVKALNELLDEELPERDRVRFDVRPGRIKSRVRAWQKLNTSTPLPWLLRPTYRVSWMIWSACASSARIRPTSSV
jgi:hypothetical protein